MIFKFPCASEIAICATSCIGWLLDAHCSSCTNTPPNQYWLASTKTIECLFTSKYAKTGRFVTYILRSSNAF